MRHSGPLGARALERARHDLVRRLRAQQPQIVERVFASVCLVAAQGLEDPDYRANLRATVRALVAYSLDALEHGEDRCVPIPPVAFAQVRLAARANVMLETVMLRYTAGHKVFGDYVTSEAEHNDFSGHRAALLRTHGALLERFHALVAEEYNQERRRREDSDEHHRAELVQRLLGGAPVDPEELKYPINVWHLGVIASGAKAPDAVRCLARRLKRELLPEQRGDEALWAWLGGSRRLDRLELEEAADACDLAGVIFAIGEPAWGEDGYRLTHKQAQRASLVAANWPQPRTYYADHMLLAAALADPVFAQAIETTYLNPIENHKLRDELFATLRAIFDSEYRYQTAGATLKVNRSTVSSRVQIVEECLNGRLVVEHHAELEVALRLRDLRLAGRHFRANRSTVDADTLERLTKRRSGMLLP